MNKYSQIQDLSDSEFRRLTGVKRETFQVMLLSVYESKQLKSYKRIGRLSKLSNVNKILMMLNVIILSMLLSFAFFY